MSSSPGERVLLSCAQILNSNVPRGADMWMERCMRKQTLLAALTLALTLAVASQASAAPIVIAGVGYDTVDFSDTLISSGSTGGVFTVSGASLAAAVTGWDVDDWAFCNCTTAYVELGFTDNVVVNGPGNDLRLFEIGTPDDFGISLTIAGATQTVNSAATGFNQGGGFGINVANVDLSAFGIAAGDSISSIVVRLGFPFAGTSLSPTLGAVVALNSAPTAVPEPGTISLLGFGLAAVARRLRKRNNR